MSAILITGASGFIGRALARTLAGRHQIVCLGRHKPEVEATFVKGEFGAFEDLRRLDAVVHLAAVTGGCSERDGLLVNVEGTRCLMRYLMDRGCRKFVMASSVAAVGLQSVKFRPLQLPMPDEHPCLDRDGYGLSKHLMEEIVRYHARQNPDLDAINLRLAAIFRDEAPAPLVKPGPVREWAAASLAMMALSDAVRAFALAVEAPHRPGVRAGEGVAVNEAGLGFEDRLALPGAAVAAHHAVLV